MVGRKKGREGGAGNAGTYLSVVSCQPQVDLSYLWYVNKGEKIIIISMLLLSFFLPLHPPSLPPSLSTTIGSLNPTAADLASNKGEDTLPRISANE